MRNIEESGGVRLDLRRIEDPVDSLNKKKDRREWLLICLVRFIANNKLPDWVNDDVKFSKFLSMCYDLRGLRDE